MTSSCISVSSRIYILPQTSPNYNYHVFSSRHVTLTCLFSVCESRGRCARAVTSSFSLLFSSSRSRYPLLESSFSGLFRGNRKTVIRKWVVWWWVFMSAQLGILNLAGRISLTWSAMQDHVNGQVTKLSVIILCTTCITWPNSLIILHRAVPWTRPCWGGVRWFHWSAHRGKLKQRYLRYWIITCTSCSAACS